MPRPWRRSDEPRSSGRHRRHLRPIRVGEWALDGRHVVDRRSACTPARSMPCASSWRSTMATSRSAARCSQLQDPVEGGRCKLHRMRRGSSTRTRSVARCRFPGCGSSTTLKQRLAVLPDLTPAQSRQIGRTAAPSRGAPMAIISPGTGLGMACVIVGPAGRSIVASEGGHASVAASMGSYYDRIVAILRQALRARVEPSACCRARGWSICTRRSPSSRAASLRAGHRAM